MEHNQIIDEFNKMIRDGKHTCEECYNWLHEQASKWSAEQDKKRGFHMNMDYLFLYPERFAFPDDTIPQYNPKKEI